MAGAPGSHWTEDMVGRGPWTWQAPKYVGDSVDSAPQGSQSSPGGKHKTLLGDGLNPAMFLQEGSE